MKPLDSNEFFNSNEKKEFGEFKPFKAEQYYPLETKNDVKEVIDIEETFQSNGKSSTNEREIEKNNNDELRKQLEQATKTSTPSSSSSNIHAVSESSVVVGSGTAAVTVTAAAVVISVTSAGIGLSSTSKYIKNDIGNDYVSININLDKVISEYDKSYGINDSNFLLKFNEDGLTKKEIPLKSGNHSYVVGNLTPLKEYSYTIECKNPVVGNIDTIYKSSFSTLEYSDPAIIKDEVNNYVSFISSGNADAATLENTTALLSYSYYLSDYEKQYDLPTLYVCSSLQEDVNNLSNIIYSTTELDSENFFKGEVNDIIFDNIYVYIVGEKNSSKEFLYRENITIDFPIEDNEGRFAFEIDESSEQDVSTVDTIKLSGNLVKVSELYPFRVKFDLFNEDGEILVSSLNGLLTLDKENLTYEISCRSFYKTAKYKYTIYMVNPNNEEITIYESNFKEYNVDQSFKGTYEKVSPENANIEYNEGYIKINVETNFTSEFSDIYYYKLKVVNSSNVVFGTYEGTSNAEIIIDNFDGLDTINFIYTDMGRFINGEVEFNSYNSSGVPFSYPYFYLDNNLKTNGNNYVLTYYLDMVYDYSLASATFYALINNELYQYDINTLAPTGEVELTSLLGQYENVVFSVDLNFVDNQSSQQIKTITQELNPINLEYSLNLKMVEADLNSGDGTKYPVRFAFDNVAPSLYQLNIKDEANSINLNFDPSRKEVFSNFNNGTIYNLTISIIDEYGNSIANNVTCKLDDATVNSSYVDFTSYSANPGDSVITYNSDGTVNMYRYINYESSDPNNYTNAMIFNSTEIDADSGNYVYGGRIDNIMQDKYSRIENIERSIYCFNYFKYYLLDDVYYIMSSEYPSGSIGFEMDPMTFEIDASGGQTKIVIYNTTYGSFENKVLVNGIEYQYRNFDEFEYSALTVIIEEEIVLDELKVYFTQYGGSYDTFSNDISMLGNKYDEIVIS